MTTENQTKKRSLWVLKKADIALLISFFNLAIFSFSIFRTVGNEKIEIMAYDYVSLWLNDEKIAIGPKLSFINYGKGTGTVTLLEAFIVSTANHSSTPNYMRYFSDVGSLSSDNKWIPFLGYIIYPKESLQFDFGVYQKDRAGYGKFMDGKYKYVVILKNKNGKIIKNLCYEFSIEEDQVKSILGGKTVYVHLKPLQEDKEKELLNTIESFKMRKEGFNIGNDDNDLKADYTFKITFDPNGGIGGNLSQTFKAGRGMKLDGGKPTRDGYIFSHWNTNEEGTGSFFYNGFFTTVEGDACLYAIWYKDYEK